MRRHLIVLAVVGLFGFVASNANACHFKPKCGKPACAPAPCVAVAPCPPPAPVCEPVACKPKCHFKMPKMNFCMPKFNLCHKKAVCAAPACESAPVTYAAAPVYAAPQSSPQVMASGQ